MENLQKQIESIKRWRWLVVAFAVLATFAALAIASSGDTTYTATSVVVVGSASTQSTSSRSPDQDAVLAAGYVVILNSPSQQRALKALGKIPDNVDIAAAPVAGSPFINLTATASTPEVALQASEAYAKGFVDNTLKQFSDIVSERLAPLRSRLQEVSTKIAADQAQLADPESLTSDERAGLNGELDTLQAEASGLSEQLRVQAAVSGNPNLAGLYQAPDGTDVTSPRVVTNGILGLIGGLILGSAVALILGALELRIRSASDVRRRLELPTLGSVSSGRGRIQDARRAEDFKILASALSVMKPPVTSISVVSPSEGEGKTLVAENLARYRAAQGGRVILVEADMRSNGGDRVGRQPEGLADLLRSAGRVDIRNYMRETDFPGLWVIPSGTRTEDPYTLFSSERIQEVIAQATAEADLVIIDTPGLLAAAESQLISAGTDGSVLVLDTTTTQPSAALEARDLLRRGGANILGVVLNRVSKSSAVYS
jgi:succinoglycan biosynthesis transport protein ExoP